MSKQAVYLARGAGALAVMLALGLWGTAQAATNLVVNGSFETTSSQTFNGVTSANFPTGWSQDATCTNAGFVSLASGDQSNSVGGDWRVGTSPTGSPTDGSRLLVSDQMFPSPCSHRIYQDVAIPAGTTSAILTMDVGVVIAQTSAAKIEVTTTTGTLLVGVYSRAGSAGNDPIASRSVDLTAYAGQTVRIVATVDKPDAYYTNLEIDNVVLAAVVPPAPVPTLSEWAFVGLAGLLALIGAIWLRVRGGRIRA